MKAKWIAGGNEATGFIAFGNVATGFIAFGNLARGFIAVGNVAVGVFALGNVGVGIVAGGGATIGLGALAGAGVFALPVLDGVGGVGALTDASPLLGVIPIGVWCLLSLILRGERRPDVEVPPLADPALLATGEVREGWVAGRLVADGTEGRGPITMKTPGRDLKLELSEAAADELPRVAKRKVLAMLTVEDRVDTGSAQGYREAPPTELVLVASRLEEHPERDAPWADQKYLQWYLAWAWRIGAAAATAAWMTRLLV